LGDGNRNPLHVTTKAKAGCQNECPFSGVHTG
jgi:hypothetical protein